MEERKSDVGLEEIIKGIELLKKIFLPVQEDWEIKGISGSEFSKGSWARCDIEILGENGFLNQRWNFLEKYFEFPKKSRKQSDICFPIALKIFEFQGKKNPKPICFSTLVEEFKGRFDKNKISIALDILSDFMFIKYYTGHLTDKIVSTGLIKFTAEIPENMKTI